MTPEACKHCGEPASAEETERLRAEAREFAERLRTEWLAAAEERIGRYRAQLEAPRPARSGRVKPPRLEWRCAPCGRTSPSRQARRIAEEAPELVQREVMARLTAAEEEFRAMAAGRQAGEAGEAGGPEQEGRRRSRWWRRG
jgi:hypothetical protein